MPTPPIAPQDDSVVHQLRTLARAIHRTPGRSRLYLLSGAIVAIIVATAAMQVRLNAWNQPFYDAISRRDLDGFVHQLGVFFVIAAILLVLNVAQTAANQLIRVRLRALATHDLIGNWMTTKRAARIGRAGEIGVNPDQRIQADTQTLTEQTTDLGIGLLQSSILLASFIGVLWMLSAGVVIPIGDRDIAIPGYMVWAALLYAISGSVISWRVGRPLVRLGADRYAQEAAFRSTLVQASERAEGIVLSNGEADSRRGIEASLDVLVGLLRQVAMARTRLTWVTAGYGWVAIVFPIIVAAPGYFAGRLTFGELMMVVGAFNQVQSSLRWFVDNTGTIADWRAALLRVMNFRQALLGLDAAEAGAGLIERTESEGDRLTLEDVRVESRHGSIALDTPRLEIAPGERVLILGKPGSGRTTFFLAIAGLWNAGSGRIGVPPDGAVAYLTQRPFLPSGPLRAVLASDGAAPGDDVLRAALERSGLDNLADSLDHDARWDRELGIGEQERLGYARLLVARPKWLVCDEGLDPLDDANRQTLSSILNGELAESAVINISQRREPTDFYGKVVELVATPPGGRPPAGAPMTKRGSGRRRSDDGRKRAAILELTLPGIGRSVSRGKSARVETGVETHGHHRDHPFLQRLAADHARRGRRHPGARLPRRSCATARTARAPTRRRSPRSAPRPSGSASASPTCRSCPARSTRTTSPISVRPSRACRNPCSPTAAPGRAARTSGSSPSGDLVHGKAVPAHATSPADGGGGKPDMVCGMQEFRGFGAARLRPPDERGSAPRRRRPRLAGAHAGGLRAACCSATSRTRRTGRPPHSPASST